MAMGASNIHAAKTVAAASPLSEAGQKLEARYAEQLEPVLKTRLFEN